MHERECWLLSGWGEERQICPHKTKEEIAMERTMRMGKAVRQAVTVALSLVLAACVSRQTVQPPDTVGAANVDPAPAAPAKAGPTAIQADAQPTTVVVRAAESQPFSTRYAHFQPAGWEELPGWLDDNLADAWLAFRKSCAALSKRAAWTEPCARASKVSEKSNESIRQFFQREFTLYEIHNADRTPGGVITGYYEALLNGSRTRGGAYVYPVYGTPDDLLTLDVRRVPSEKRGEPLPARLEGRTVVPVAGGSAPYVLDIGTGQPDVRDKRVRLRLDGNRIVPYYTRAEIDRLGLPKARVLVWVDNPAALYSMQIQGSGKVRLPGGALMRLAYAEQNGHPFRPPGSKTTSASAKTRITTRGLDIVLPEDESDPFGESEVPVSEPTMRGIKVGETDRPQTASAGTRSVRDAERRKEELSAQVEALVEQLARGSSTADSPAKDKPRPLLPDTARPPRVASGAGSGGSGPKAKSLPGGVTQAEPAVAEVLTIPAPSTSLLAAISADPSYVFFREIPDSPDGPLGALGVPLTAGRSVAVDPRTTPLGFPLFMATTEPGGKGRLNRLMMAQDTGGAIRGAVRADYFWGFGAAAYAQASRMKESGRMWLLLPRGQQIAARDSAVRMRGIDGPASAVECVVADPDLCVEDR